MSRGLGDSSPIYGIIYEIKWRHDGTPCNPSVKENEGCLLIDEESWYWFVADGQWWRSGWSGARVMTSAVGASSLGREQPSWRWRSADGRWKEFSWLNRSYYLPRLLIFCILLASMKRTILFYWKFTIYFPVVFFSSFHNVIVQVKISNITYIQDLKYHLYAKNKSFDNTFKLTQSQWKMPLSPSPTHAHAFGRSRVPPTSPWALYHRVR